MKDLTEFLELFMEKTGFPEDSRDTFRAYNRALLAGEASRAAFDSVVELYESDDPTPFFPPLDELSESLGFHKYTGDLFIFMYQAWFLREAYKEKGLPEQIYWDSMTDLRAKLIECRDVYGVNGSFVASWFHGFFELTRFALGRLQFEWTEYSREEPYTCCGHSVSKGDTLINMHIPSLGPLTVDLMMDAFKRAYNFPLFADVRVPGTDWMPFCCGSWLLYPPHYDFLPAKSNILKFMDCFDIVEWSDSEEFSDKWRVFGKYKDAEPADLPRDTSLRRAFAERLESGQKTGHGWGIFFFDGEKIIRPDDAGASV
ncbi:MAG: DUF5596 domain-containing protein [Clostridia bacterium]|nr:DUF5596 domain-containing protein [Clostridia bacterium]